MNKISAFLSRIKQNKVAIIQARMGSSRLPGKMLMPVNGIPALMYLINRIKKSKYVDKIIVATTQEFQDDKIVELCVANDVQFYRGSENDVLLRVYQTAVIYNADVIIDITGDCIFADPKMIDRCIIEYYRRGVDYVSTDIYRRSWFDGNDIQVYSLNMLKVINMVVLDEKHRCHTGWNIPNNRELIKPKIYDIKAPEKYTCPDTSVVLDTKEDYEVICKIADHFGNKYFSCNDIIDYLRANPELQKINENKIAKIPGEG